MNNLTSFNAVVNNLHTQLNTTGKILKELILKVKSLEERFNESAVPVGQRSDITENKIKEIVTNSTLSEAQILSIVQEAISKLEKGLSEENVLNIVREELSKSTQNIVLPSIDKVLSDVLVDDDIVIQEKKTPVKKPRAPRSKKAQAVTDDGETGSS